MEEMTYIKRWETSILRGNFLNYPELVELSHGLTHKISSTESQIEHQDYNLFDDKDLDERLLKFRDEVVESAFRKYALDVWGYPFWEKHQYSLKAWTAGLRTGYSHSFHHHSDAHLSGGFYLEVDGSGGELVFHDPRFNFSRGYGFLEGNTDFSPEVIRPCSGDFFIFPSSLYHQVESFKGTIRLALIVDLFVHDN